MVERAAYPRHQERVDQSFFLSPDWLLQEVIKEKHKPVIPGQTPWYHLAGTGFFVKEQVAQLVKNVPQFASENFPQIADIELGKVGVDMLAFEDEYLKQLLTLRFRLAWENGKVICPDYNNQTWESVTAKNEREGAAHEVLFGNEEQGIEGIESWLRTASPNSFAVIVSPEGWSGLKDANGDTIEYPETQVYAVRTTADGGLQAYTFRYKANIVENARLQQLLGLSIPTYHDQKQLIKDTLRNAARISSDNPNAPVKSFEDIVDFMQQAVGGREEAYDGKTFNEIRRFLRNPELFEYRHILTMPLIQRFQAYARWQFMTNSNALDLERNLQIGLAVTVTNLSDIYEEQEKLTKTDVRQDTTNSNRQYLRKDQELAAAAAFMQRVGNINYTQSQEKLQERPGCAGGGSSAIKVNSMGVSRNADVFTSGSSDYDFDKTDVCVVCHEGPKAVGPCNICISCDADLGGKAAKGN